MSTNRVEGGKVMLQDIINKSAARKAPEIHQKFEYISVKSQVVNVEKKKVYEYYICDNCGAEIEIQEERNKMTGGIITIPYSLTRSKPLKLALCNKCVGIVEKQFTERNMIEDNRRHIPQLERWAADEIESEQEIL